MLDVEKFIAGLHDYIGRALSPIAARIKALEERAPIPGPKGDKGELGDKGINGDDGRDGKDVDPEFVRQEVLRAVDALPKAKDGRDGRDTEVDLDAIAAKAAVLIPRPQDGQDGRDGRDGKDGKSISSEEVVVLVRAVVAELPPAAAGKDGAAGDDGKDGQNGKDADPAVIASLVEEGIAKALPGMVQKAIDALMPELIVKAAAAVPAPKNGRDGIDGKDGEKGESLDEAEILAKLTEKMIRAVDALPKAKDGRNGRDAEADLDAIASKAVALIPRPQDGQDGKDAAPETIRAAVSDEIARVAPGILAPLVVDAVSKGIQSLPTPKDGKDADLEEIAARVIPEMQKLLPVPRDGQDGKSVTLEDIRPVLEGETARWQLEFERRAGDILQRAIDAMPRPENGKDGFSPEDFDVSLDGRMLKLSMRCGDRIVFKALKLDIPIDRGVYRSGMLCEKGDVVTFGGSQWIALKETKVKPPSDDWRCQVQRGRDGKDAQ